jgi:hypothetical protein
VVGVQLVFSQVLVAFHVIYAVTDRKRYDNSESSYDCSTLETTGARPLRARHGSKLVFCIVESSSGVRSLVSGSAEQACMRACVTLNPKSGVEDGCKHWPMRAIPSDGASQHPPMSCAQQVHLWSTRRRPCPWPLTAIGRHPKKAVLLCRCALSVRPSQRAFDERSRASLASRPTLTGHNALPRRWTASTSRLGTRWPTSPAGAAVPMAVARADRPRTCRDWQMEGQDRSWAHTWLPRENGCVSVIASTSRLGELCSVPCQAMCCEEAVRV